MDRTSLSCALGALSLSSGLALAGPVVFSGAGANPGAIQTKVDAFRTAISLGGGSNTANDLFTIGRREVNWDGAGADPFQSPALMPGDFFNNQVKRGAVFSTTDGAGFLLSKRNAADPNDPARKFGDIDPSYATEFQTFSPLRLFGVKGGVVTVTNFFVPGTPGQAATVNGFGAVFTDVDSADSTSMELFDRSGNLLYQGFAPVADKGLSFLGVQFDQGERVFSVRIHSGNAALGNLDGPGKDVVAMDDFIYSEPLSVPGPGPLALALAALSSVRRGKRR